MKDVRAKFDQSAHLKQDGERKKERKIETNRIEQKRTADGSRDKRGVRKDKIVTSHLCPSDAINCSFGPRRNKINKL